MSAQVSSASVEPSQPPRISWVRCKVPREEMSRLNKRSDFKGLLLSLSHMGLLICSGALAIYSFYHWRWYVTVLITFMHGTFCRFAINAFHELVHDSVFKTRWLNGVFLRFYSFIGWWNHHWFWASHTEHHKYTLHDPHDMEVVLPYKWISLSHFLKGGFCDPRWFKTIPNVARRALGNVNPTNDPWTAYLYPPENVQGRRDLIRWSRVLILGHGLIFAVSMYMHWWFVPVVVSFNHAYGGWLQYLCNETQHAGLQNHVPDFRLCCRTIYLNPFFRFLYWNMNYHTEHHMFAAVPCYNLGKLHRIIKDQMPPCPSGLWQTWRQIGQIMRRQKQDPGYQYIAPVPPIGYSPAAASADGDAVARS